MINLAGNLRTMPLPDILQWIATGRKTGTLHLSRRSIEKRLVFEEGVIHSSWSNDPRESLGQFLIRDGLLTEEQLFKALLRQEAEGRLLGSVLVADGALDEEKLRVTLRHKAEETVYDLFLWPDGQFEFHENEVPFDVVVHVDLNVTEVVLEGVRRVDDWERMRKVFPSADVVFRPAHPEIPDGVVDVVERRVLEFIASSRRLSEIALELRRSEYDATALMFDLYARELVTVKTADPRDETDAVGAIRELLTLAYARLQERRYDAAERAYLDVLALDRLNQHAKKGLLAVSDARSREHAAIAVPLDKVPVMAVDLSNLTTQHFEPQEAFVLSRVNGQWDVRSIQKLCPLPEDEVLAIFSRLLDRGVIRFEGD